MPEQHAQRIELVSLPRRAPELNPQEYVNQDLKGHVTYDPKLAAGILHAPRDAKAARLTSYAIGFSTIPEDVEISWK